MAPTTTKASTPKAKASTTSGVSKTGRTFGPGKKKSNTRNAMVAMQAFFKEQRPKYKDLAFKDQQKALGADWKKSPKNPKVAAASA